MYKVENKNIIKSAFLEDYNIQKTIENELPINTTKSTVFKAPLVPTLNEFPNGQVSFTLPYNQIIKNNILEVDFTFTDAAIPAVTGAISFKEYGIINKIEIVSGGKIINTIPKEALGKFLIQHNNSDKRDVFKTTVYKGQYITGTTGLSSLQMYLWEEVSALDTSFSFIYDLNYLSKFAIRNIQVRPTDSIVVDNRDIDFRFYLESDPDNFCTFYDSVGVIVAKDYLLGPHIVYSSIPAFTYSTDFFSNDDDKEKYINENGLRKARPVYDFLIGALDSTGITPGALTYTITSPKTEFGIKLDIDQTVISMILFHFYKTDDIQQLPQEITFSTNSDFGLYNGETEVFKSINSTNLQSIRLNDIEGDYGLSPYSYMFYFVKNGNFGDILGEQGGLSIGGESYKDLYLRFRKSAVLTGFDGTSEYALKVLIVEKSIIGF